MYIYTSKPYKYINTYIIDILIIALSIYEMGGTATDTHIHEYVYIYHAYINMYTYK
jgi:hypothetical protein